MDNLDAGDPMTLQVGALELLTRYSINTTRAPSLLTSLDEHSTQADQLGYKEWSWKHLKEQFSQKELEVLYRKYDDKLREKVIYVYISLLILVSTCHILFVAIGTYNQKSDPDSFYLSILMYLFRIAVPALFTWKCINGSLEKKSPWVPIFATFVITLDVVFSDIAVSIYGWNRSEPLRPAYGTLAILSVYVLLPMRNIFVAIVLSVFISCSYIATLAVFTYFEETSYVMLVGADIIYHAGVNLMGVYFRVMSEIVTRRSFLDRRACVETTVRLKFVEDQEKRLMSSILPDHIISRVRQDIRTIFLDIQSIGHTHYLRTFSELYVEEHEDVSILYADVVNYTMISTTLSPLHMLQLLNELFSRFDQASKRHDAVRIKFLGDCYYCVSGIPKPTELHAKNCVDLGLDMIQIVKNVRETRALDIDMRIGVHSGRVLSGLIGIRKWQFDIWSKDVTIAQKMESTGIPGKVHVTKQTLEMIWNCARDYIIEPNFESQNHHFIKKNKLETFLISKPSRISEREHFATAAGFESITRFKTFAKDPTCGKTITSFMDENLVEYQKMLKAADDQMIKEIEDMKSDRDPFRRESIFNKITLMYKDSENEKSFFHLPDPLFKYYITCCLVVLIMIFFIRGLTTEWFTGYDWHTWLIFGLLLCGLILMQPLIWFQHLWNKCISPTKPSQGFLSLIYETSSKIITSAKIRTCIYLLINLGLVAISVANVGECNDVDINNWVKTNPSNCVSIWHVTQSMNLALLINFLFSRVFFLFKWLIAGATTLFYIFVIWNMKSSLYLVDETWNVGLDARIAHTLCVLFIAVTLYWIDRITEFRNRLDHFWQIRLCDEQQEAETMLKVNHMLLENILPAHVVHVYLDLNRCIDEPYYEKYDNVAVMFASLNGRKIGTDDNTEFSDKQMLTILNQVISNFDKGTWITK